MMMKNDDKKTTVIHSGWSGYWITIGLWVIFFWGDPDLRTALIEFLNRSGYN
jgi:hypothetical protein